MARRKDRPQKTLVVRLYEVRDLPNPADGLERRTLAPEHRSAPELPRAPEIPSQPVDQVGDAGQANPVEPVGHAAPAVPVDSARPVDPAGSEASPRPVGPNPASASEDATKSVQPKPRSEPRSIELFTPDEVAALIELASKRSPTGQRNRALLALLFGAGLRIAEALALEPADIDLDASTVTVRSGAAGSLPRTAEILPLALPELERWLERRDGLGLGRRTPFFCTITSGGAGPHATKPGTQLSDAYVRGFLSRHAKKAKKSGFTKRLHAHGLRHSHAYHLRNEGWDVHHIQRQLGHASLAITGEVLERIGAREAPPEAA